MNCSDIQQDLERYLAGDLPVEQRAAVESHLQHCEACSEGLGMLAQVANDLKKAASRDLLPDPGPSFNEAVWNRIDTGQARRKRFRVIRLCLSVAAAAAVIVVTLLGFVRPESVLSHVLPGASQKPVGLAQIMRQTGDQVWVGEEREQLNVGDWLYSGKHLHTGKQGRLELAWGSGEDAVSISVETKTELMLAHSSAGGKQVHLIRGEVACQAGPQPAGKPLVVLAGDTELTVVGTTFSVVAAEGKMRLAVQEGTVQLLDSTGATKTVTRGFIAVAKTGSAAAMAKDVDLARGIDARVRFKGGTGVWDLQRRKDGVFIRQTSVSCGDAVLFLGKPIYQTGLFTGRMRVLALGEDTAKGEKPGVGFSFHHDNAEWEAVAKGKAMGDGVIDERVTEADIGRWRRFNAVFQVLPGGRVVADHIAWDEDGPVPLGRLRYDYTHEHEDGPRPQRCSIGVACRNVTAEFTDLRVVPFDHPDGRIELTLRDQVMAPWKEADCNIDFTQSKAATDGEWHLTRTDKTVMIQQSKKDSPYSMVWFGEPRFRRGVFCGEMRMVMDAFPFSVAAGERLPSPKRMAQFTQIDDMPSYYCNQVFHYPPQSRKLLTYDWRIFISEKPIDIWTRFVVYFDLVDDKLITYTAHWDEGKRFPWGWTRRVSADHGDRKITRPFCNIGVGVSGMRMEYRNLRVIDLSDKKGPLPQGTDEF